MRTAQVWPRLRHGLVECGSRDCGLLVVGHYSYRGTLYIQCKVYLASIEKLESYVKGAMFEDSANSSYALPARQNFIFVLKGHSLPIILNSNFM